MKIFATVFLAIAVIAVGVAVVPNRSSLWPNTTKIRQITVFYPTNWLYGDNRSCTVDSDYKVLDCTQQEKPFKPFTINAKFSGKASEQSWTCQNDGLSLVCKN